MVRNVSCDPLLLVIRQRQEELLSEAASWHLANAAKHRYNTSGKEIINENRVIKVAIWRKAAWTMGKVAISLGSWLVAR